jgi:hypothetical protein
VNQKLLEDKLISLNGSMTAKDLGQVEFFCELFRNNKQICLNQFDEISDDFVRLIKLRGRRAKYLDFFIVVQRVGDEFLHENQKKVLNLLIDNSNQFLLYNKKKELVKKKGGGGQAFQGQLEYNFDFSVELDEDEPYEYHAKLVELFSNCTSGKESFAFAE